MSAQHGAHGEAGATNDQQQTIPGDPAAGAAASTDASLEAHAKAARKGPAPWLWALLAAIVVVAIVIGVVAFRTDRGKPGATAGGAADSIAIGLKLAPTNLDIRNQSGSTLDQILIGNVYEGLVTRDERNQVAPGLAERWEQSKDGLTYTFHLHTGMTFSNGDTLDASDIAWSIDQLLAKRYYDSESVEEISGVKAEGADTVVITLSEPNSQFLWTLAGRPGLAFDKDADYDPKTQAVGSGPYLVDSFRANDSLVLKANPGYWGSHKARTGTVTLRFLTDDNAAVNALRSGDVQVLAPISANLAEPFERDPAHYEVKAGDGCDKYVLAMNNKRAPFTDKRVRQAIRYGIDHKEIIASRGGADAPLGGPIPSVDPGYEDLTGLYPHDVAKAQALMREAGYSADHPLKTTLTYANTYGTELGDQLRSQLKEIYIDLTVNVVEFSTWLQDVHADQDYDLSLVDHNDSHDFFQWATPSYYYGYDNPEVRRLYAEAIAEPDQETSDRLLARAARIVSEDAAADWLFNYRVTSAWAKGVTGFPVNMNQTRLPLWNVAYAKA